MFKQNQALNLSFDTEFSILTLQNIALDMAPH